MFTTGNQLVVISDLEVTLIKRPKGHIKTLFSEKEERKDKMKNMKKLVVLILSVLMVLGTSAVTSFAAVTPKADKNAETDGVVTVSNAKEGQTYTLYKLFNADMGANNAITYTLPSGKTEADLTYNNKSWFELNDNGFVVAKSGTVNEWAKDPDALAWARQFGEAVSGKQPIKAGTVTWDGLAYGYYYVDTTLGSFVGIDSANKTATIQEKNEEPSVDKEIVSTTNGVVGNDSTKGAETDKGKNEAATAQVGDTVTYKVTVTAKPGAQNYVVTDTLSAGLTAPAPTAVTVDDLTLTDDYTVTVSGQVITVTFTKAYLDTIKEETKIVINYTAVLNSNAVIGAAGNPNTVKLTWGHDNKDNHSEDDAKVYTAQISAIKTDNQSPAQPLAGAGFVLKNAAGKYYKLANGVVTWVDTEAAADEHVSDAQGAVAAFTGLTNGKYTLVEKTVPDGYNKLDDTALEIKDDDYTDTNLKKTATVVNNAGTELPSTGGMGTTILYIIGGVLVAVSAIMLVAKKRTSDK